MSGFTGLAGAPASRLKMVVVLLACASLYACGGGETVEGEEASIHPRARMASWKAVATSRQTYAGSMLSTAAIRQGSDLVFVFGGPTPDDPEHVCASRRFNVVRFGATGDVTVDKLPGAVHAREMVAVDFNGDSVPDIFSANHGCDGGLFAGEKNSLFLSNGGGYAVGALPNLLSFTHSADAADIDGDGDNDILVGVYGTLGSAQVGPYFLINDGGGRFTRVDNLLPARISQRSETTPAFTSVKLIDVSGDGKVDVILGGDRTRSVALINNGVDFLTEVPLPHPVDTTVVDIQPIRVGGVRHLLMNETNGSYSMGRLRAIKYTEAGFETVAILPKFRNRQWMPFIHIVDLNGDGRRDILFQSEAVAEGDVMALGQTADGKFVPMDRSMLPATLTSLMPAVFNGRNVLIGTRRNGNVLVTNVYEYR
jgi:hypothetical protein